MIKFIFFSIQIIIVLFLSLYLSINNFKVSFEINDFIYIISSSHLFILFIIFFIVMFFFQSFYFKTKFKFKKYKLSRKLISKEKGYNSFVSGMLALANKDFKNAILESNKVANYLDESTSLSLLLKSEIFKVDKQYLKLNDVYEEMIKNESTKNLGYRGLMEQYLRSQDYHHAFIYAEKLFNRNPYVEKIYETLISILIKTNNWQQLITISDKALSKKIIDRNVLDMNKSIAYYEIAKIKQYSDSNESMNLIKKSLKLRKKFPPYIKLYLELLIQNKENNLAKKQFRKFWSEIPHPEFKDIINSLSDNLKIQKSDLVKFLISSNLDNHNSRIFLLENLILEKKWDEARSVIKNLIDANPTKIICLLMAKIEEGDTGDVQKSNAWIMRSKQGLEEKMWICILSKKSQNKWSSISDNGYFNSLEWKQPSMLNSYNDNNKILTYEN